jgi:regulator of RNase E activity RraB
MITETEIQDSIRGHEVRNAELLRTIQKKGLNLDTIYFVEHHFWSNKQSDAALLAKELYGRGYLVLVIAAVTADDGSRLWNVEAGRERTFTDAAGHGTTEELVRLAAKFDSIYDGWGVSI